MESWLRIVIFALICTYLLPVGFLSVLAGRRLGVDSSFTTEYEYIISTYMMR